MNEATIVREAVDFIKQQLFATKRNIVLGLSGGLDSAVVYMLCMIALVEYNSLYVRDDDKLDIYTYALPYFGGANSKSVELAKLVDKGVRVVDIKPMVDAFNEKNEFARANIMARIRMTNLYNYAYHTESIVVNTCNLSEDFVGYATKFGDHAGDFAPIAHLTKTQLFSIARYLNVPKDIVNRKPSAELWDGQTDEDELGFSYKVLDEFIVKSIIAYITNKSVYHETAFRDYMGNEKQSIESTRMSDVLAVRAETLKELKLVKNIYKKACGAVHKLVKMPMIPIVPDVALETVAEFNKIEESLDQRLTEIFTPKG